MDSSPPTLAAEVQFKDEPLALIHIPLRVYPFLLQELLSILLGNNSPKPQSNGTASAIPPTHWTHRHGFLSISLTPVECSIVCSRSLVSQKLSPAIQKLEQNLKDEPGISISSDDFLALQIEISGDLEPDQRIVELTSPLALAGVSIFFITTYFSDYILVPARSKPQVIHALQQRGFIQSDKSSDSYVVKPPPTNQPRPNSSSSHGPESPSVPSTPPPRTVPELQARTFKVLKSRSIVPTPDPDLHIIQCAAKRELTKSPDQDAYLRLGLHTSFTTAKPSFLSITLTNTEDASLLMERRLRPLFGSSDMLLGSTEDILVPITLDLRTLPFESTGIVCGISGRIASGTAGGRLLGELPVEIRFLSTARAATVVVEEKDLERAVKALEVMEIEAVD